MENHHFPMAFHDMGAISRGQHIFALRRWLRPEGHSRGAEPSRDGVEGSRLGKVVESTSVDDVG